MAKAKRKTKVRKPATRKDTITANYTGWGVYNAKELADNLPELRRFVNDLHKTLCKEIDNLYVRWVKLGKKGQSNDAATGLVDSLLPRLGKLKNCYANFEGRLLLGWQDREDDRYKRNSEDDDDDEW